MTETLICHVIPLHNFVSKNTILFNLETSVLITQNIQQSKQINKQISKKWKKEAITDISDKKSNRKFAAEMKSSQKTWQEYKKLVNQIKSIGAWKITVKQTKCRNNSESAETK